MMRHKHADLIHAWAEGAEIEYNIGGNVWCYMPSPVWSEHNEYRIKPKEPEYEWQWIYKVQSNDNYYLTNLYYKSMEEITEELADKYIYRVIEKYEPSKREVK